MRVALVSDAHLAGPEDPGQRRLLAWLAGLEADRLVLGGDLFERWWHFGDTPFSAYAEVVEALRPWAGRLVVLPGNHDFHAPAFFARALGAAVPGPDGLLRETWDGLPVVLEHGDAADTSAGYRLLSAALRGPAFDAALRRMGPDRAWRFLGRLVGRGRVEPAPWLVAAQRARAARLAPPGGLVVMGHSHAPTLEPAAEGRWLNLGAWLELGTWATVQDGVPRLHGTEAATDQGHRAFAPGGESCPTPGPPPRSPPAS